MDLSTVKQAVDQAVAELRRPPEPDEPKYVLPLALYMESEDWERVWHVVRKLRLEHPEVFIQFSETTLANLIIEELAEMDNTPSLQELASHLLKLAQAEGPWLVSTPISNIETRDAAVALGDDVVLWRAVLGTDWINQRFADSEDDSEFEVHEFLEDQLPRVTRWLRNTVGERTDTGVGAQLLTVEEGTAGLAQARARAKAQYALAVWPILWPPEQWHLRPDLGIWVQQPDKQLGQCYKLRESGWIPRDKVRGNAIRTWGDYSAPEADLLRIPFEAIANLDKRSSQGLLSAALAHHQAGRLSRFLISERVRSVFAAIECLCEPEPGERGALDRWKNVAARFDVWSALASRGFDQSNAQRLQERLKDARNVATHGADAVLIDLGFPQGGQRKLQGSRSADAMDLQAAAVQSDLWPLVHAVGLVIEKLLLLMAANGWDDQLFEQQFV